jgi:hypothetical protein
MDPGRPGKSVQCSSDPEFAFFKCSSIVLVVKLLRKQNNLQILLTGYEEHFVISKYLQILYDGTFSEPHFSNSVFE